MFRFALFLVVFGLESAQVDLRRPFRGGLRDLSKSSSLGSSGSSYAGWKSGRLDA